MGTKGLRVLVFANPMTPIVLRVKQARELKGWTQAELAERAGVRRATISSMESRTVQRVNLAALEKVAKALGMPTLRLLQEGPPKGGKR